MHQIAGIAVTLKMVATDEFGRYTVEVIRNAQVSGQALTAREVPLVTGGTENHLLVLDVAKGFSLDGATAQQRLEDNGLITNKQLVPDDSRSAARPSGLRIGTPAVTTRELGAREMERLAELIVHALSNLNNVTIAEEVRAIAEKFPIPGLDVS